jgi:tetratricopeptide (TPR) repeat protein
MPKLKTYKTGDFIGRKYEVSRILGQGSFGVVYLVYNHETHDVYALKTYRDEYLGKAEVIERFRKEANLWVDLDRHPYLVRAYLVEEIAHRLYIALEYISPNETGLNTLAGYLQRRPPDLAQSLRWAIQFCQGMEYALSKGTRSHRDIKPANIMITQDMSVKITDFGLAAALSSYNRQETAGQGEDSMRELEAESSGTPAYMSPEQFRRDGACDERSDIYSFGVVLYQMATAGETPFRSPLSKNPSPAELWDYWENMRRLHEVAPVAEVDSPLFPIIRRCLAKHPEDRHQTFYELRRDLDILLRRQTGEVLIPPALDEFAPWEWTNKGLSLSNLGRDEEALACYDKAMDYNLSFPQALHNKGLCLSKLGRHNEALRCFEKSLDIDPLDSRALGGKAGCLRALGRHEEALRSFNQALQMEPVSSPIWISKGRCLVEFGRFEEARGCFERALEIDPRSSEAWYNIGHCLQKLRRFVEAMRAYDRALEIDPFDSSAWVLKSTCLQDLGQYEEALRSYEKALEIDPGNGSAWILKSECCQHLGYMDEADLCYVQATNINPRDAQAWLGKGNLLEKSGQPEEAVGCYDRVLALDARSYAAWYNKGGCLLKLAAYREALNCFERALELEPENAAAWLSQGIAQDKLGLTQEARRSYQQFIAIAPRSMRPEITFAYGRVEALKPGKAGRSSS